VKHKEKGGSYFQIYHYMLINLLKGNFTTKGDSLSLRQVKQLCLFGLSHSLIHIKIFEFWVCHPIIFYLKGIWITTLIKYFPLVQVLIINTSTFSTKKSWL